MSSVEYIFLFCEYIENVKSYRNKKLCTQMVFLKFCKIVINYDSK
jgi:hypothetical protein